MAIANVNGDAFDDVIVGSRGFTRQSPAQPNQAREGLAAIYLGSASGIPDGDPSTAQTRLESNQMDANLGIGVSAGDVNGDGFDDVIVGAFNTELRTPGGTREAGEGAAYVFRGSATGIASSDPAGTATLIASIANTTIDSNVIDARLGWGVAGAGDFNGDGFDDVIVGTPFLEDPRPADSTNVDEGIASLFFGSAAGIANGVPATSVSRTGSTVSGIASATPDTANFSFEANRASRISATSSRASAT